MERLADERGVRQHGIYSRPRRCPGKRNEAKTVRTDHQAAGPADGRTAVQRHARNMASVRKYDIGAGGVAVGDGFRFKPGERLVERTLCERLGVSRSVVREVLRHLEAEGLVETIPHQGPAVTRPDPAQAAQIYEIRGLLESEAARACAEHADDEAIAALGRVIDTIDDAFREGRQRDVLKATTEFYEKLFHAAGKEVAWDVVRSLNARINHLRSMTIATEGRHAAAIGEMRMVHDAIRRRDGAAAFEASRTHVATVARLANSILGNI